MNEWNKLKKLAGYIQNVSDVTIKLFQDDATGSCWIQAGEEKHFGSSFDEALAKFNIDNED